jgi:hypothetical protein
MKTYKFEGNPVRVKVYDTNTVGVKVLFEIDSVAKAVGYSKTSSLLHHVSPICSKKYFDAGDKNRYIDINQIKWVSEQATKTPRTKTFYEWAKKLRKLIIDNLKCPVAIPVVTVTDHDNGQVFGISAAAEMLSMHVIDFSNWLIDEGYATRYRSNNAINLTPWFKAKGYGTLAIIQDGPLTRSSNVPKITRSGFEFIKNRMASKRMDNVLFFTQTESNKITDAKLEKEIDALILSAFKDSEDNKGYGFAFTSLRDYKIGQVDLIKNIKSIISQIKLKEKFVG